MKHHELKTAKVKQAKRVGRGISAGQGKTAGRGTKGQGSRTGSKAKPGFIGGALPLMQKLPHLPGFKSHRAKAENVYTGQLNQLSGTVDARALAEAGLITNPYVTVKVISQGELTKKIAVKLPKASQSAITAIETAGGSFEPVPRLSRPQTSTKKAQKTSKTPT
jgi:large subunit ribosomal protein L15